MVAVFHEYQWLVVVGALGAFGFGYATGSNDVANAFATSVGSKALKLWQAVIIAAVFEFTGALVLGRVSTSTIAGGIAKLDIFTREPEIYAYGMCCALGVGTVWQLGASYLELNVSATHSIIGAIMGFGLVYGGKNGVVWAVRDKGAFPPYKGVVSIMMAWVFSPLLTGALAALIFFCTRFLVLRRKNAYTLAFWTLPPFVLVTVWTCMYFVFTKGAKKLLSSNDGDWTDAKAAWISAIIAAGLAVLTGIVMVPLFKWMASKKFDKDGNAIVRETEMTKDAAMDRAESGSIDPKMEVNQAPLSNKAKAFGFFNKVGKAATHGMTVDIHKAVVDDEKVGEIHANAEVFEPRVELAFSYLQVFSACCVIFAHGAGEVGYMAGPLTTIWDVYQKGILTKDIRPPIWILLIGAFGLVFGLATYGYNVTRAMGVRLAKITPTRGFAAELATAAVIMIASQYGLPTSSSQCITGGIVGVGLMDGVKGVNWRVFARQFASWVLTLFAVGLFTAALFAQGVYSPSKIEGAQVITYENRVTNLTQQIYRDMNTTLFAFRGAANDNALTRLPPTDWATLNRTLAVANAAARNQIDPKRTQTVRATNMMTTLNKALALLQQYSINTLGQNNVFVGSNTCNGNTTASIRANENAVCVAPRIIPSAYATKFP